MNRTPRIVLDPAGLDQFGLEAGQFRYIFDLLHEFDRRGIPAHFLFLGATSTPNRLLADLFSSSPSRWEYVPAPRPLGRAAWLREQLWLSRLVNRLDADLYHSFHTVVPLLTRCPTITTVYDLMVELFPEYVSTANSWPYRLYRWGTQHRAKLAVCISQTTADDVQRLWKIPEERIAVIHCGTTFTSSSVAEPVTNVTCDRPIILSAFNLEPRKNLASLVRAFVDISRQIPDSQLVLYGNAGVTPERLQEFNDLIAHFKITSSVIRTGRVPDSQLAWLYQAADVFVFPSLYEGFGYPILESMAAGGCVIARDASAMAEVVDKAGLLIETSDPSEISSVVCRLLKSPSERSHLGHLASERAKELSVNRMADKTLNAYQLVLKDRFTGRIA